MKQSVLELSVEDFLNFSCDSISYEGKLIVANMRCGKDRVPRLEPDTSVRLDAFSIFLVRKGKIRITIDEHTYNLSDNVLMNIVDRHAIKDVELSPDFKGYHLVIEWDLFSEIMLNSRRLPASYIATHHRRPILVLKEEEGEILEEYLLRIVRDIKRTDNAWQRDIILNELRGILLEMNNIIHSAYKEHVIPNPSDKNELLILFVQLLHKHCKEEHAVSFYARELSITPEYLSRILKSFSGKTVSQWISDALMREAEVGLRNPDLTIQQVSDMLNFSDQSAFGKFFKKHRGISPLVFKRQYTGD